MPNIQFWKQPIALTVVWITVWIGMSIAVLISPPAVLTLPVGGDPHTGMRDYDAPYLEGFWPSEPRPWQPAMGNALRWSKATWQIHWPHAGAGWWVIGFRTDLSGKVSAGKTNLHWQNPAIGNTTLASDQRITRMLVNTSQNDTPNITIKNDVFHPNGDARALGIAVKGIALQPLVGISRPTLLLAFLIVNLFLHWVFVFRRLRIVIPLLTMILWLSFPAWIALHSELIIGLSVCGLCVGSGMCWMAERWHSNVQTSVRIVVGMVSAQLMALWSPYTHSSDIAMHVRMLNQVISGQILFTAQLPCEASAFISPYPPLTYILMAPLGIISHDASFHRLLLIGGAVIFQAIALWYCYTVFRQHQLPIKIATLFLVMGFINAPLIQSIHVGEFTNAWGQSIALIAMGGWIDQNARRQRQILWTAMALVSHTGVSISLALMLGIFAVTKFLRTRIIPRWFVIGGVSIAVLVIGMYYSNFAYLIGQAPGYAGCPPIIPILARFKSNLRMFPGIIIIMTGIGLIFMSKSPFRTWILSGFGAAVCSIFILLFATQTVRWGIAVAPFVAIAAAFGFSKFWRFGRAGKILLITTVVWYAVFWYSELWHTIMVYLHD